MRVFRLHRTGPTDAEAAPDEAPPYQEWDLPAAEFQGIWPSLIYDTDIKATLLAYATTALLFSDRCARAWLTAADASCVSPSEQMRLHATACEDCRQASISCRQASAYLCYLSGMRDIGHLPSTEGTCSCMTACSARISTALLQQ